MTQPRRASSMLSGSLCAFLLGAAAGLALFFGHALPVHRKIVTWLAAPATVVSLERGSRTVDIRYSYVVDGRAYVGSRLGPSGWSDARLRQAAFDRFPPGTMCEAYYNPDNSSEAFLLRQHSFGPYVACLSMVFFGTLLAVALARPTRPPAELILAGNGWYAIPIEFTLLETKRWFYLVAGAWNSVGLLACGHFFLVAETRRVCDRGHGHLRRHRALSVDLLGRRLSDNRWILRR